MGFRVKEKKMKPKLLETLLQALDKYYPEVTEVDVDREIERIAKEIHIDLFHSYRQEVNSHRLGLETIKRILKREVKK